MPTTAQLRTTDHDDNPGSLVTALPSSLSPADTSHHRRIVSGRHRTFPAIVLCKRKACAATINLVLRPASSSPNFETEAAAAAAIFGGRRVPPSPRQDPENPFACDVIASGFDGPRR